MMNNGETWSNPFQQRKQAKDRLIHTIISWGMTSLVIATKHKKIDAFLLIAAKELQNKRAIFSRVLQNNENNM